MVLAKYMRKPAKNALTSRLLVVTFWSFPESFPLKNSVLKDSPYRARSGVEYSLRHPDQLRFRKELSMAKEPQYTPPQVHPRVSLGERASAAKRKSGASLAR